jgi:endonuclease G
MEDFQGYQTDFMGPAMLVSPPTLDASKQSDLAPELTYTHFSVYMSHSRHFPYFTATNINGALFQPISRDQVFDSGRDEWTLDHRQTALQWGQQLYNASKSDFQRGHMTKREDPQWGSTPEVARRAAQDTFKFSNCVPQLASLNTEAWGQLETFILKKTAVSAKLLIAVFTGPVLAKDDLYFVTRVKGDQVQLPALFWKVVYYDNGLELARVGFMMSQEEALKRAGIAFVTPAPLKEGFLLQKRRKDYFADYKDAALYQVDVSFIEELTGLRFHGAVEPYQDTRARELILQKIQVPIHEANNIASGSAKDEVQGYDFTNMEL